MAGNREGHRSAATVISLVVMKRHLPLVGLFVANLVIFAQADTGAITGRIFRMDGLPAAGVRVAIISQGANGKIEPDILAGITVTDESGRYLIENIPPGRYGLVAGAVAAPTFYPGTTRVSEASLTAVQRGSTTAGLDFALAAPSLPAPAPGTQAASDPSLQAQIIAQLNQQLALPGQVVLGRVVIEGPLISTFLPNLKVTFFRIVPGSTAPVATGRIGSSIPRGAIYSASTDIKLDNRFRLELKPMSYRISIGRADNKPLEGFVLKSITLGTTDLMKEELRADAPVRGEIVITLQPVPISRPIK